jgi:hypothetical protein
MTIDDRDPSAYYRSKLGVAYYDLFTREAHDNGPVNGDVAFYVECAREFGGFASLTGRTKVTLTSDV